MKHLLPVALMATCQIVTLNTWAHEGHGGEDVLEEIVVYGRSVQQIGTADSASQGVVGLQDIQLPPLLRVGELVEAVPGMVATQHSGTGKANQYFLRGFNLDHGTDFSASLDGVPLNMRTHGHGQGYLDLNPLIPELVRTTRYEKGPYAPEKGDFASAGSVDFEYYRTLSDSMIEIAVGEDGYRRLLAIGSAGSMTAAIDVTGYEGPWEIDENLKQHKAHVSWAPTVDDLQIQFALDYYDADWDATDQIPSRAVEAGLIDELGFIDPDLGGSSTRLAARADLQYEDTNALLYVVQSDFSLFSNFTYLLNDPVNGDEFEQEDERLMYGGQITTTKPLSENVRVSLGAEFRHDDIQELGLYSSSARNRLSTIRRDEVDQTSYGAFTRLDWQANEQLRVMLGLRADHFTFDVDADQMMNSGSSDDTQLSPKLTLAYLINDRLEAYANFGRGMHSNDVRGAVISVDPVTGEPLEQVPVLVPTEGGELGLRYEFGTIFNASIVLFTLDVDSELVFVGDGGGTEPNDGSERTGLELNAFYQPTEWLSLNASYTYTDASYEDVDSQFDHIPGAIESTFSAGANMSWASGFSTSIRLRYLGEAPLIEDNSIKSDSSLLVNAALQYERGPLGLKLEVFNLTDSDDTDISYFYESRLPGEPANGVSDIHYHPLEPRTIRFALSWRY